MKAKHKLTLKLDEIAGFLRTGHLELELDNIDMHKFNKLDKEQQIEWISDEGELELDDYDVEHFSAGDYHDIKIESTEDDMVAPEIKLAYILYIPNYERYQNEYLSKANLGNRVHASDFKFSYDMSDAMITDNLDVAILMQDKMAVIGLEAEIIEIHATGGSK